jgi:hypothetical protein
MVETLTKEDLKKRQLVRMFEPIEGEMSLIEACVKFNYTINKTPQKETKIMLAFAEDTEQLIQILKERVKLLLDVTS